MEPRRGEAPISINRLGIMTARLRIIVAASACLLFAGSPALAQDAAQQQPDAPVRNDLVGPPQLSNFSLNGTVTRAAPAPARPEPARQTSPRQTTDTAQRPQPARDAAPPPTRSQATASPEPAQARPQREPDIPAPAAGEPASSAPVTGTPAEHPPALADPASNPPSHGLPILPWIVAAVVAAGAAAWFFFFRMRTRASYAGISSFDLDAPAKPAPGTPVRPSAAPQPKLAEAKPAAPTPVPPSGIVSTRLRPWLEIEFKPDRAVVDDNRAAVAFEIFVVNSGNVPARDVLLEASLFNAGPMQDQQIQLFFDNPVAKGDRIPVIPPMQRINVNTAVFMARDQVQPIEIEGRPLFVPMIAFNALYSWGGGEGQTSASYLVGKETSGDKLAPVRLDLGPRIFRGLGTRVHELNVRK
jgi:hypothetical protein